MAELSHRQALGTIGGGTGAGCAILFGLPFLAAGVVILLAALGHIDGQKNAPTWVIAAVGLVFGLAGLGISLSGVRGALRARRRERDHALHPDEPWRWDYPWDGERCARIGSTAALFAVAGFMTLFLVPFNYFMVADPKAPLFAKAIVGLFDLLALAVWWGAFYGLFQRLKYADGEVRLVDFPCQRQRPIKLRARFPRALRGFERLDATLRIVRERWERRQSGSKTTNVLVMDEVWKETRTLSPDAIDGGGALLEFTPPADAATTELSHDPPIYWELELKAETPGIDYHACYLVPVY